MKILNLNVKFVENQFHGSTKVLILKNGLICPNCQDELGDYYSRIFLNLSELLYDLSVGADDYPEEYYDELESQIQNIEQKYTRAKTPVNTQNNLAKQNKVVPYNIYRKVTQNVIGQDEQIKEIIAILIKNNMTQNPHFKSNIFLIGGTGNGKSESIKQIAKELSIPFVIEDSSKYTQEGYVGESVENALGKLILQAGGDIKKAERGIIIFDEIDKKTDNGDRTNIATTSVQDSLLKMLEGTIINTARGQINTELITFILIGACENSYKEREKRLSGKGTIGFTDNKKNDKTELKNPKFIPEDLINSGFKSEFMGRIDSIIEFNPMDMNMALKIINDSKISIFNIYLEELKKLKVDVKMNRKEVVEEIAKRAIQLKIGARGIRQIVIEMFNEIYSSIVVSNISLMSGIECYITKETVYDNKKFKLRKKQETK